MLHDPLGPGQADVEELVASRQLQKISGAAANGGPLLDKAGRTLATAESIATDDPDSAFVLAYDSARYAGTALLAHQGLRPTTSGGHYVVELALRAQFGDWFFGTLRRRRNELEYPSHSGESASQTEAAQAVEEARAILTAAQQLPQRLGLF